MIDLAKIRARLPGRQIEWFASVDSTMKAAAALEVGAIAGAEEQIAGIGRHGHSWHSPAGAGLYISVVLPQHPPANSPLVMLALGLAVRQAVGEVSDLIPDVRWPNDVLIRHKKCAGILAQTAGDRIIAGIGINVNHREFPPELTDIATSLRICGAQVTREDLLVALARAIDEYQEMLCVNRGEAVCDEFLRTSSYAFGKRVTVDLDGHSITGTTEGLDESGFLRVKDDRGVIHTILAGGVRAL